MKRGDIKPGDVVRYTPSRDHCREGMAWAIRPRGRQVLVDTYWNVGVDSHVLTDEEIATAEVVFNTNDFHELPRYDRGTPDQWKRYAPKDRETISAQRGLQHRYFVRKGASEDWDTIVANARDYADECAADAEAAVRRGKLALDELERVLAQRQEATGE
ncbi:hypothetical protein HH308_06415 [Gordonia sp. TBRC 11910]|uniref:Uncharacterized protein n=1 Tax=Gordonia asplenii TaxID=2725283 RepID=A0A848KQ85_9ACTN|nr:hypothetical protein [Gordonia asplenii]NMO00846.1 hypothetical protein [Gordonia asplenii]